MLGWAAALGIAALVAAPEPRWLPGPPRAIGGRTLVDIGEDGRLGVLVDGVELVTWDLESGKRKLTAKLPRERWHALVVAPRTDGEAERALILASRRVVLVHLRTGRLIADWPVAMAPAAPDGVLARTVAWSQRGERVALAGWELPDLALAGDGTPVVWVDAETGTVVSRLRLPDKAALQGIGALADGALALGTLRRIIVLGPGPSDARTIGVASHGLVGVTRDGIVVVDKAGRVAVVAPGAEADPRVVRSVGAPAALAPGDVAMGAGGRFAVARVRGAVFGIDLASGVVSTLSELALGRPAAALPSLGGLTIVGRRVLRLDLTSPPAASLLLDRLCVRGDCERGEGTLVELARGRRYTGSFRGGRPEGQGSLTYEDGAIFTGPFVRGEPHGAGTLITPAGDERRVLAVEGELSPAP